MPNHAQVPVQVWADIDVGIAKMVEYMNTIPGVRTFASCQGTLNDGGPKPYKPRVMASWDSPEALVKLTDSFDTSEMQDGWGEFHPREGSEFYPTTEHLAAKMV